MANKMEKFRPAYKWGHRPTPAFFIFCLLISGLFSLAVSTSVVSAATYYVDPVAGNDSNTGTSTAPWKTIDHAESASVNNSTVYLRSGNYGEVTIDRAGNSGRASWSDAVTFIPYPEETVVFSYLDITGNQSRYLTFEGINIVCPSDEAYSTLVRLQDSSHIKVIDCNIVGRWDPADSNDPNSYAVFYTTYAVYIQGKNNGISDILIENCNIEGAYRGINTDYDIRDDLVINDCNVHEVAASFITIDSSHNNSEIIIKNSHLWGRHKAEGAHGSGIAVKVCHITISGNVIRDYGGSGGIRFYEVVGLTYEDMLIENNLIYDSQGVTQSYFGNIGHDVVIINNTFIGRYDYGDENTGRLRYGGVATIAGNGVDAASDVNVYNNIFVGLVSIDSNIANFTENYNIFWAVLYGTTNLTTPLGPNSIIIRGASGFNPGYDVNYFEGSGNFFVGGSLFDQYSYETNHKMNLDTAYRLGDNSPAINFGDSNYATISDILGVSRDFSPDAGCYEYISQGNNAPVLQAIGNKSVNENALLTFTVSATDADSDTITYSASGTAIDAGAVLSGQTFSWTPGYNQAGSYEATFIASDGQAQDSETITITVNNVNRAPVLEAIGSKSVDENNTLSFSVSATDADSDTITYSASGTAIDAGAVLSGQTFSWTPGYNQAGSYEATFIASDGQAQDSETITITVNNVNRAPTLESIGNKSVDENNTLSFSVSATDADNDTITYSVESLPSGAAFASQTFIWIPGYNQAGTYQVTFVASDDSQAQDSEAITVTVNNANRAPVLSTIGNQSVYTDDSLTFTVIATDADSDTITYSAEGLPGGATFADQTFSWTPSDSQIGSYEVTFIASDGNAQDSESITITVSVDTSAPSVTNCSPAANDVQVPLNNLIILHIVDTGEGVDANSVTIKVNNSIVYTGNTADYSSEYGHCRRVGTKADYTFIYQANDMFDFDQTVTVTVNATDIAGNAMSEYSYSFRTEMRSFGQNKKVNSGSDNSSDGAPSTVRDSSGDIWVAWHEGQTGSRDVYIGKLTAGADNFGSSVQLTSNNTDQCNTAIAVDAADKLYVVWQDNRRGNWDIYISTSTDGINWAAEKRITDSNDNQVNPAIAVDSSGAKTAYIVWQDDQAGNQDIYVASSSNDFVTTTISQITSDSSDQTEPAVVADSDNTIYVVWTDTRGGSNDIYGAASNNGPWTNVAIVSNANNQSSPAIAAEAVGSILHLLWVDNTPGNRDIYYASSNGLPASPLTGSSIIDDTSSTDQLQPTVTVTGSTGNNLKVFACWQDERNADTDLYFVEAGSGDKTNVLIGDDGSNANQSEPAIGADIYGHPYIVWADSRNTSTDIYYAGCTFIESTALISNDVSGSLGATVGTEPANISSVDDVSIIVPAGAYACDIKITISRVKNPPEFALECFSLPYEFGPSGINFDQPVTITIPYEVSSSDNSTSAYWYNPLTGTLSQQGITDIENIVISSTLYALRFKTTHLTQFIVGGTAGDILGGGGGGGGGGGCAMSPNRQGNIIEFLLPYAGYIMVMIVITCRDALKRKARNTARNKC